jgi:hypothetical protein
MNNEQNSETADLLRNALRLAWSLATAMAEANGTRARQTRLALRAADALQELHDLEMQR